MANNKFAAVVAGIFKRRWLLALVIVAGGIWWWLAGAKPEVQNAVPVKADARVLAEGIVFPVTYAQMVMPIDGTIGEINTKEGEHVQAGQSLIRLVRQDYQARVGRARADVVRAAALVDQAEVNLSDARREFGRQQQLASIGAVSRQLLDQAITAVDRNQAALAQAVADFDIQQEKLVEAAGQLEKTELKAPISGIVSYLDVKVGEHATTGTVLVRLADASAWEVRSDDLTELSIAKIRVGDQAVLTFDGIPDLQIAGQVKFIRPYGEKKRGDITYTVTVEPHQWDERLRWNMTAQLAITPSNAL